MSYSVYIIGFPLVAVVLLLHVAQARDLSSTGLLDEMPENCSNAAFCAEKHADYPQKLVDRLLSENFLLTLGNPDESPLIEQRISHDNKDCRNSINYAEIYEIIDKYGKVRVVVQSEKLFKQQIRIEKCKNPGRLLTRGGTAHFSPEQLKNHNISCIEETMNYHFLVLTRDGTGLESIRSIEEIPVACNCKINVY